MKSFTVIAITAALASAASAFKHEGIPEISRPGVEIETRPPVIVVETVTLTKSWAPKETGSGSWKSHKYGGKGYHHDDKDEDEDEDDEDEKDDDKDDGKKEWKGIHANSFAPKASFNAAQASSFVGSMTSAAASRATSVASRASSAAASASSSVVASHTNSGANLRVGGALVAGAAGIAAYLLL